jgi:hypothetical protein
MSPKGKAQSVPRPLAEEISLVPTRYRAGVYAQLQMFGDWKGDRQMLLSETMGGELAPDSAIEVTGLDLSVSEAKAFHAIQVLMDKTGYRGNMPGREVDLWDSWKWRGTLPSISITYSDYFEAYGLQRKERGDYYGRQAEEALKALDSLTEPRRIVYERKSWEGKGKARKQVSDIIVRKAAPISLWKAYQGLEQEEAARVRAGQEVPQRVTRLVIEAGPVLMDGIEDFYLLKPITLHDEIRQLLGSRRISRTVSLFIEWLLTKNLPKFSIGKENLAYSLRLDYLIEQRKQSLLDKRLQEAIDTALELRYLLDYEEDALGVYHFTLNPDRMGRPPKWQLKEEGEDGQEPS